MADPNFGRISSITLENFKGISKPVNIPLRPITLLFGKNSAGKSTILQAMLYARELLRTGEVDIDKIGLAGDAVNLGGFKRFVHRDGSKSSKISERKVKFRFDLEIKGLTTYKKYSEVRDDDIYGNDENSDSVDQNLKNTKKIYVEFIVASPREGYLSKICNIGIDDELFSSIAWRHAISGSKKEVCDIGINKSHTLTKQAFSVGILEETPSSNDQTDSSREVIKVDDIIPCIGFPISFSTRKETGESSDQYKQFEQYKQHEQYEDFLNRYIMRPLNILKKLLDDMRYIGPIREILPRDYGPRYTQDNERWASGLAAWDILMNPNLGNSDDLLQRVNAALENLQLDYELHKRHFIALELNDDENIIRFRILAEKLSKMDEEKLKAFLQNEPKLKGDIQVFLKEKTKNIEVALCDIGVGISQVLPVVVGALADNPNTNERPSILAIEQPELHVHPAVQCELGDLFIRECKNQMFLIETHSEHLLLRILRRINENYKYQADNSDFNEEDFVLLYIDRINDTTTVESYSVDPDGQFEDPLPKDFFEERQKEWF